MFVYIIQVLIKEKQDVVVNKLFNECMVFSKSRPFINLLYYFHMMNNIQSIHVYIVHLNMIIYVHVILYLMLVS